MEEIAIVHFVITASLIAVIGCLLIIHKILRDEKNN